MLSCAGHAKRSVTGGTSDLIGDRDDWVEDCDDWIIDLGEPVRESSILMCWAEGSLGGVKTSLPRLAVCLFLPLTGGVGRG